MSSKPLRFLGIEIDLSSKKAKDDLADWNREIQEALGLSEGYADGIDDMAKEMSGYAKQTGLTKQQLKDYKETIKKSGANDFTKKTGLQASEIKKLGKEANEAKGKVSALKGVMAGVAAIGLGSIVKSVGGELIGLAKEAEKTNLSFELMLKNKQQAKEAVTMLNDFADSGAFSDTETLAVGKRLLNLKMPIDEVKQTLHELGNVAAGSGMSLESLSEIYANNKTLGLVEMSDIKKLSEQGIPIFEELGNVLGVNAENSKELAQKIKAMSQGGVIQFDHLRQAFSNMSKAGGDYAGVMDRLSQTGAGLAATFGNKLSGLKAAMGMVLLEGLKPLLAGGIKFLDWLQKSPKAMTVLKTVMLAIIPTVGVLLVAALYSAATAAWAMAAGVLAATWPFILIGAAILTLILIIEDLYTWFTGGESVIGEWVAGIKKDLWELVDSFISIPDKIKSAWGDFKKWLKGLLPDWALELLTKVKISGSTDAVEARAGGGSVASGETYLVGERGPELFTPSHSGTIIPNKALSGAGKSANITIAPTFNISGTSDPERLADLVMKKIKELIPAISAELGLEV